LPLAASQEEVSSLVAEHVLPALPKRSHLISVDGLDGSGKSTIGRAIAGLSERFLIEVDEFLQKQQGQFLDALRLDDLNTALIADEPSVIEGCLVEAVLQKLERQADFRIYVARTGQMTADPQHEWCDEYELLIGSKAASELLKDEERELKAFCESGLFGVDSNDRELPGLRRELITYHREFEPHKTADLIVKVVRQL
jgi:hypothetical protein